MARANELILAKLRPGTNTRAQAAAINKALGAPLKDDKSISWFDAGSCEKSHLDLDTKSLIQTIHLSIEVFEGMHNCNFVQAGGGWKTGRGLSLRTPCSEVSKLYGEPGSRSPSTKNGQPLELLYYAFDWAGPDVPQVMEVVCTAPKDGSTGRVVEITLAAGSL